MVSKIKDFEKLKEQNKKLKNQVKYYRENVRFLCVCDLCEYPILSRQGRIKVVKQSKDYRQEQLEVYHLKCWNKLKYKTKNVK